MSLVYITYHDENIKDIEQRLKETTAEQIKRDYYKKYDTKFRYPRLPVPKNLQRLKNDLVLVNNSKKYDHKTFGEAPKSMITAPCNFLRKSGGIKCLREPTHKCIPGPGAPPLPPYTPQKKKEVVPANMIKRNIRKCLKTEVRRPRPLYVDTVTGNRQELINSGMIPQYVCSKTFGKVPKYVKIFKKEFAELKNRCFSGQKAKEDKCMNYIEAGLTKLTEEERSELLAGLLTNFTELIRNYQSMSLNTDTVTKMLRKSRVEKQITQVEKDIAMLNTYPVIYISTLD